MTASAVKWTRKGNVASHLFVRLCGNASLELPQGVNPFGRVLKNGVVMRESVLQRLCCSICRGSLQARAFQFSQQGEIDEGVAWCTACRYWYPIEGAVLELLPPKLAYAEDRCRFW